MKIGSIILPITMAFVLVQSKVYRFRQTKAGDLVSEPSENRPIYVNPTLDLQPAATHHDGHHGRVQIKVYRGPDDGHHAPHGYWVKQPADDHY